MAAANKRVRFPGMHGRGAGVLPPAKHVPYLLNGRHSLLLRWLKVAEQDPHAPDQSVLDKLESGQGQVQGTTVHRLDKNYHRNFTADQRERLERLEGETGLWWLLRCNAPTLVDDTWDWWAIVGLMQAEKAACERLRDGSQSSHERLNDWIELHHRHGALNETETGNLRADLADCTSANSFHSTIKASAHLREYMGMIGLAAWARIGLLIEHGLVIRAIRHGCIEPPHSFLDTLLGYGSDNETESRAFGRYLLYARNFLSEDISWDKFADNVMPTRTPEAERDKDNLKRRLRAWRNGGETPSSPNIRALAENVAARSESGPSRGIADDLTWAGHLAVALERLCAGTPGYLVDRAVRRQRAVIGAWLPAEGSTRPA